MIGVWCCWGFDFRVLVYGAVGVRVVDGEGGGRVRWVLGCVAMAALIRLRARFWVWILFGLAHNSLSTFCIFFLICRFNGVSR